MYLFVVIPLDAYMFGLFFSLPLQFLKIFSLLVYVINCAWYFMTLPHLLSIYI